MRFQFLQFPIPKVMLGLEMHKASSPDYTEAQRG